MKYFTLIALTIFTLAGFNNSNTFADCPLDHLVIGINQDGIPGTADDMKLFFDCEDKYRNSSVPACQNWYYPLLESIFPDHPWRISEPGFAIFQNDHPLELHTYDPNRAPDGTPTLDYRLIVQCTSLSDGLIAAHSDYPQFTIGSAFEQFDFSQIHYDRDEGHVHMSYRADNGSDLRWITFVVYDSLQDSNIYQPSEPCTIVFNTAPLPGDIVVDGSVNFTDLARLAEVWTNNNASVDNDFLERADTDRNGKVNLIDFAALAQNWMTNL